MQTAQRQGGHPLRVVPRCDVNRVHSIRFTCQVRWAGLVGSEAPFLVDRVQALLMRQTLRNDVVSASQQSCNPSRGRPRGDITHSFPEVPRMLSGCLSTCATAGVIDDAGPSQGVWITSRAIDYLARGSWATSSGSRGRAVAASKRPGTGSETTQPHFDPH